MITTSISKNMILPLALTVAAILLTTMAMRTVARRGVEVTATPPATLVRTPLDKQIIADGRIGSHNLLAKIIPPFTHFQ